MHALITRPPADRANRTVRSGHRGARDEGIPFRFLRFRPEVQKGTSSIVTMGVVIVFHARGNVERWSERTTFLYGNVPFIDERR